MLLFNINGNGELQTLHDDAKDDDECIYNGLFKFLLVTYLLMNYVWSFSYIYFSLKIFKYQTRYLRLIAPNAPGVAVWRHRTNIDWQEGYAYALYTMS